MSLDANNLWPNAHAAVAASRGDMALEMTADDLVATLAGLGFPVTRSGLSKAHRADLIPRPRVVRLGRGKGTESWYPREAVGRYAVAQAAFQQRRSLPYAAWRLWWAGFDQPQPMWKPRLERAAVQLDGFRALALRVSKLQDGTDRNADYASRTLDRVGRIIFGAGVQFVMLRRLRKDLGRERLRQVIEHFTLILAGRFISFTATPGLNDEDTRNANALMDVAFATGPGRTDYTDGARPWLTGDVAPVLARLSAGFDRGSAALILRNTAPEQLAQARGELGALLSVGVAVAQASKIAFGESAFGLRRIDETVRSLTPDLEAMLLVMWLQVRPEFEQDAARFLNGIREAIAAAPVAEDGKTAAPIPRLRHTEMVFPRAPIGFDIPQ
jgi:hypothetical protein